MTKHQSFWPRALTWLIGVAYVLALGASVSAAFYVWDRMAGELMSIVCHGGALIIMLLGVSLLLHVFYGLRMVLALMVMPCRRTTINLAGFSARM